MIWFELPRWLLIEASNGQTASSIDLMIAADAQWREFDRRGGRLPRSHRESTGLGSEIQRDKSTLGSLTSVSTASLITDTTMAIAAAVQRKTDRRKKAACFRLALLRFRIPTSATELPA